MIEERPIVDSNPYARMIEYCENGQVLGYLKFLSIYDKIEIENIEVLEQYRGLGIGKKLMAHLISIAISDCAVNITLEVRVSNDIARNLYKNFGFREVALRKFYYGDEDAILMEKQVM